MIIGISGKIGSGKDTVGELIQRITSPDIEEYGSFKDGVWIPMKGASRFQVRKFADALKDNVCRLLGVDRDKLEDRDYKETPLGEEWWYYKHGKLILPYGHYKGEDKKIADERYLVKPTPRLILQRLGTEGVRDIIHPNAWVNATFATYTPEDNWILTDMRFPNELDAVILRGGVTFRTERGDGNTGDHPSEIALDEQLDKFDYILDNNGTIEELEEQLKSALRDFDII